MELPLEYLDVVSHTLVDLIADNVNYLQIAHILLTVLAVQQEWNPATAKKNPLATYIFGLAACNAGGLITSILTSNAATPLGVLFFGNADPNQLAFFTVVWWLMFYAPHNAFSRVLKKTPVIQVLYVAKELLRCKKIYTGVALGKTLYSGDSAWQFVPYSIVLGTIASCGTGFLINLGHSISLRPYNGKLLLSTSVFTKISIVLSAAYAYLGGEWKATLVLIQATYMICYKLHVLKSELISGCFESCGWIVTDLVESRANAATAASAQKTGDKTAEKTVEKAASTKSSKPRREKKKAE